MTPNIFQIKPAIYHGLGAAGLLDGLEYQRALVVTDPFMQSSGRLDEILQRLRRPNGPGGPDGLDNCRVFAEIRPDPDTALIAAGVQVLLDWRPDLVLAVGGGSAIDAAKGFLYCSGLAGARAAGQGGPRFIAIPTTSGTGSEVTNFSVITMDGVKIPLVDDSLLPDQAIIDASFTLTVPPAITADTGVDVLTHALEAYVSRQASNYSDAAAEKAAELVFQYLPRAVKNGQDREARENLHDAACLAGMAFTNAKLGINHSLAHALGGAFHVPHGRANAILMPLVIAYNAADPTSAARYAHLAGRLGLNPQNTAEGVYRLVTAAKVLLETVGIPASLAAQGLERQLFEDQLESLARAALADACTATNPVRPSLADLQDLYQRAYGAN